MNNTHSVQRISIGEQDGWAEMVRLSDVPIKTYQVIGERSCGTNYVQQLIAQNLRLKPENLFQWKHGYPVTHFVPRCALVVVCFRDPVDWLKSMHQKPWHTPDAFWNMPFSEFIRTPWKTQVDDWIIRDDLRELRRLERPMRYAMGHFWNHMVRAKFSIHRGWVTASKQVTESAFGLPLQHDRDPIDGSVFQNILQLRNAKTRGFLSLRKREVNYVLTRYEIVRDDPEAFVEALATFYDLKMKGPFVPIEKWLGTLPQNQTIQQAPQIKVPDAEDLAFIRSELNWETEQECGYSRI